MPTILHLLLALALSLFVAFQAGALVFVLRSRRALAAGRRRRRTEVLWTVIPVVIVIALAARSWVAVFDLDRPAVAAAVIAAISPPAVTAISPGTVTAISPSPAVPSPAPSR